MSLTGMSVADFTPSVEEAFKATIAEKLNVEPSHVTLTYTAVRRALSITFRVYHSSSAEASTASNTLGNFLTAADSGGFAVAFTNKASLPKAKVGTVSVTNPPRAQTATTSSTASNTPAADGNGGGGGSGGGMGGIIGGAVGGLVFIGLVVAFFMFRRRAVAGDGEAQLPTKVTDNTAPTMSPGISTTSGGCSMQLEAPGDHAQDEAVNELHVQLGFMPAFGHASVDLTEEDDPHSPIGIALRKSQNPFFATPPENEDALPDVEHDALFVTTIQTMSATSDPAARSRNGSINSVVQLEFLDDEMEDTALPEARWGGR